MAPPLSPADDRSGIMPAPVGSGRKSRWMIVSGVVVTLSVIAIVATIATRSRLGGDPEALLQRAQDEFRAGRNEEAWQLLDRLASIREPTPVDRLLRGQVSLALGQPQTTLDELRRIPEQHPVSPIALQIRGQVAVQLGRIPEAEAAFLKAITLQPRHVQARRELTFIYAIQRRLPELDEQLFALSELGELSPSYVLHWAKIRNANWNYTKDLDNLRRFVAGDPDDRHSLLTLAEAVRRSGRIDEAEELLDALPDADPDAAALRAELAMERADLDRAEAMLDPAPRDHPAVAEVLGEIAMLRGDPAAALPLLRIAQQHDPIDRQVNFRLARALTRLGRPDEAAPYLELVRRNDGIGQLVARISNLPNLDDPDICVEIGRECLAVGRHLEARAWFNTALSIDPFHDEAQRALARLDAGSPVMSVSLDTP